MNNLQEVTEINRQLSKLVNTPNLQIESSPKAINRLETIHNRLQQLLAQLEASLSPTLLEGVGGYYLASLKGVIATIGKLLENFLAGSTPKYNARETINECIEELGQITRWIQESFGDRQLTKEDAYETEADTKLDKVIRGVDFRKKILPQANDDIFSSKEKMITGGQTMSSETLTDVVIITALQKERDAVLRHLDSHEERWTKNRTFYKASIPNNPYQVIVLSLPSMGNIQSAIATHHAIAVWNPAHIILAGIAGGRQKKMSRYLGDVVVGEQIIYYELGKQTGSGIERRPQVYRPAKVLLEAARNLARQDWAMSIATPRPDGTTERVFPQVHFGTVASGEKVIANSTFVDELHKDWSELIAIEMEGAGSAIAAYENNALGVLLVKGICDWADSTKNDDWQEYAAEASAAFVVALLKSEPFESKLRPQPIRKDGKQYTGKVKIQVCRRLINDWLDLADFFEIPPYRRARFQQGREPYGVWEWLEERNKLSSLEDALRFIDREDVLEDLDSE